MDIRPEEVESVKVIGNLFGTDVKLVKTHGGFHIAVGKKKRSSGKTEALAAGSHQALVAHHIAKEFGSDFQPAMFKSEHEALEKVEDKTQYLPSEAINKGIELFTLSKGGHHEFILYRRGITLFKYDSEVQDSKLIIKNHSVNSIAKFHLNGDENIAKAMARAIEEKAEDLGVSKVEKGYL